MKKLSKPKMIAVATTLTLAAGSASALTSATFNLSGGDSTNYSLLPSSFNLSSGGIDANFAAGSFTSISVSGNTITSASFASDPRIGRYSGGAGVTNSSGEAHWVDGYGRDDFIVMTFSESVSIAELIFGYYDSSENFRWMYDSSGDGSIGVNDFISNSTNAGSDAKFSEFNPTGILSKVWAVGAFGRYDDWKFKAVTVNYEPSVVPLPATGLLLAGALAGFGAMRRRKTKAA